jgi:hypothetical protein
MVAAVKRLSLPRSIGDQRSRVEDGANECAQQDIKSGDARGPLVRHGRMARHSMRAPTPGRAGRTTPRRSAW